MGRYGWCAVGMHSTNIGGLFCIILIIRFTKMYLSNLAPHSNIRGNIHIYIPGEIKDRCMSIEIVSGRRNVLNLARIPGDHAADRLHGVMLPSELWVKKNEKVFIIVFPLYGNEGIYIIVLRFYVYNEINLFLISFNQMVTKFDFGDLIVSHLPRRT